ncbi:hypothetical protein ACMFMF_009008 [Clarireedia jacksonii]
MAEKQTAQEHRPKSHQNSFPLLTSILIPFRIPRTKSSEPDPINHKSLTPPFVAESGSTHSLVSFIRRFGASVRIEICNKIENMRIGVKRVEPHPYISHSSSTMEEISGHSNQSGHNALGVRSSAQHEIFAFAIPIYPLKRRSCVQICGSGTFSHTLAASRTPGLGTFGVETCDTH